jgi:hypothetical protein
MVVLSAQVCSRARMHLPWLLANSPISIVSPKIYVNFVYPLAGDWRKDEQVRISQYNSCVF